jgi:hypothetical protein
MRTQTNTQTITAKGQVTFRKDLLQHLGVQPGEKISFDKLPGGRLQMQATSKRGDISNIFGMLYKKENPTLSIDEMNEIIAKGWAGEL